jgi:hypothetical protein
MRCPRCRGCMHTQYGESWCLNCGYRLVEPWPDDPPVTDERWQKVICVRCNTSVAVKHRDRCFLCQGSGCNQPVE